MHPISGVGFCGPRSRPGGRSLRSSAPPPDLGHLDDESLASLSGQTSSDPPDAFEAAIRLLGQRPHGEVELRRKLARRSCPSEEIDRAMARLHRLGYLDDGAFARALVAHRSRERGSALIAAELAARGISRELAGDALAGVTAAEQVAAARRLAAGRVDPRRLAARLQRRGFAPEVIREALDLDDPQA